MSISHDAVAAVRVELAKLFKSKGMRVDSFAVGGHLTAVGMMAYQTLVVKGKWLDVWSPTFDLLHPRGFKGTMTSRSSLLRKELLPVFPSSGIQRMEVEVVNDVKGTRLIEVRLRALAPS